MDPIFHQRAEEFFRRYEIFIQAQGKSLQFGVDCFVQLHHSVDRQRERFLKTGRYESASFEEVNRRVYADPEVMQCHMHGLVFAQFLWPDQYRRFQFFADLLPQRAETIQRYLEIGGGHALYAAQAARVLPPGVTIDMVDISRTSLELAKGMVSDPRIQYHWMNVFDFPHGNYDFITMGEVLEHVERPQELLEKLRRLLAPGGRGFITAPANAPMIDHIYLFRNAQEIRDMLTACGFRIECEATKYAVDISESLAERMKLPLMYAALVRNEA
jgi:2-polyprenyl-3-methyl-5-hydroxy-6-metoxy-1,4-benzoquinol methylase